MKKFSFFLMTIGLAFIIYGGYQIWQTNKLQNESLAEAKELIQNRELNSVRTQENGENDTLPVPLVPEDFNPGHGDTVGVLDIPRLDAQLPIIEGTHEDDLDRGVGHYKGTGYPLQNDQIVLSGHRDTVFRGMGELEIGDILTVDLEYGTFSYEITDFDIVSADDRTVIRSTAPD